MSDLFSAPIGTDAPLDMFPRRDNHPVQRKGIVGIDGKPMQTNKWYSNLFLGSQTQGVWSLPYMLWVSKDAGNFGLSISHTDANQLTRGPDPAANPVQYFFSPLGLRSLTFGASEFTPNSTMTTDSPTPYSINLNLYAGSNKKLTAPLVQGMGFVTAQYTNITPVISSGILFRTFSTADSPRSGVQKWRIILEDGKIWLLYASSSSGSLNLVLQGNSSLVATGGAWSGVIQVAKLPNTSSEGVVDSAAGAFVTSTALAGNVSGSTGKYSFIHQRSGQNNANALLMYALPHHVDSFDSSTARAKTGLSLQSPTKGMMMGVLSDKWNLVETGLPTGLSWLINGGSNSTLSASAKQAIGDIARDEVAQDMDFQSNLDSMYFSGKALAKFAQIVLVLSDVVGDEDLARDSLVRLESAMQRFSDNRQKYPLVYDRTWKGLVSDAMYRTGDPNIDFGNSYYNDHHFHYGYFIYAAAVIGYLERKLNDSGSWIAKYKPWVNQLVRDVANPHSSDPYFPVSRAFDWWNGHSWAKGLFESADGKDQESSSEDVNYAYSQKLWASVIGDSAMGSRADLMLGIMKRSFNAYFLLSDGNKVQPSDFIKNKVTGILFENKVDHATYFGMNAEFIQGIHMLPLTPASPYYRSAEFVRQEWDQWFSGRTSNIDSGWKGVIYANVAMCQAKASWAFFTQSGFNDGWLDGGASRSWYLAFAAGLGGAQ